MTRVRFVARVGLFRSPRSPFVVGSLVVHVLLALAIAFFPSLRPRRPAITDAIAVRLTAGPPAPRVQATAPAPAPPAPRPEPEPQGARIETPEPAPAEPKPRPKPEPADDRAPRDSTDRLPEAAPSGPTPDGPTSQDDLAGGLVGNGSAVESLDLGDVEFAWYRDRVAAALHGTFRPPILGGVRDVPQVTLAFEILRNGAVRNARIEESSGVPSLDRAALRAVIEADPLPALPSNWRSPTMSARFRFRPHVD